MTPEIVNHPAIEVMGFATRTSNQREMSAEGRIGPLWHQYMTSPSDTFPGVTDPSLTYSIYTGYESDETGAYDVILGKPVGAPALAHDTLRTISIPAADYAVFPSASATPDGIRSAWSAVYEHFRTQSKLKRAFTVDFERYSPAGVQLYIAVR
jgi:predicted transcriptional regulator YdeE